MFRYAGWADQLLLVSVEPHDRGKHVFLSLQEVLLSGGDVVLVHPARAQ